MAGSLSRRISMAAAGGRRIPARHRDLVADAALDLAFHAANTCSAWRQRASFADFWRRMAWVYAAKISAPLAPPQWTIGFRYPPPIGRVRLQLRCNRGADAFIHS